MDGDGDSDSETKAKFKLPFSLIKYQNTTHQESGIKVKGPAHGASVLLCMVVWLGVVCGVECGGIVSAVSCSCSYEACLRVHSGTGHVAVTLYDVQTTLTFSKVDGLLVLACITVVTVHCVYYDRCLTDGAGCLMHHGHNQDKDPRPP